MIQDIIEAICDELADTEGIVGDVIQHAGDVGDLIGQPKRLPALWVVYDGAVFQERRLIGAVRAEHVMRVTVVLMAASHRSRADGAEGCYGIIEAVRTKLIGHQVGAYGELWPEKEALIDAGASLLVYGLTYRLATHVQ
jgi:phage gp37-like protein